MAQESNLIQDFGEKIGGAKKDWFRGSLQASDLDGLSDIEVSNIVTRDNIWKVKDYNNYEFGFPELRNGDRELDKTSLYFIRYIRSKIQPKLKVSANKNNQAEAMRYIKFISLIRYLCEDMIYHFDISSFCEQFRLAYTSEDKKRYIYDYYYTQGLTNTFLKSIHIVLADPDGFRDEALVQDFPNNYNSEYKNLRVRQSYTNDYLLVHRSLTKTSIISNKRFKTKQEALDYVKNGSLLAELKGTKQDGIGDKQDKPSKLPKDIRPQLSNIDRQAPDIRRGKNITTDDIMDTFKFRGGEFGNWNTQADRQACLNYLYDSLMDLSFALDTHPSTLSLGLGSNSSRKLAIAFGARGSGKASAHYEPDRVVINLTKMKGAGSLAHEMGHALDDTLGLCADFRGITPYLSHNCFKYTLGNEKGLELSFCMLGVLNAMMYKPKQIPRGSEELEKYREEVYTSIECILSEVRRVGNSTYTFVAEGLCEMIKHTYDRNAIELLDSLVYALKRQYDGDINTSYIGKILQNSFRIKSEHTDFYRLSAKADTGRGAYYSTDIEMFARSFESYVEDKLTENGISSQYLVHSTSNDKYGGLAYIYSEGEERERINRAIDGLLDFIRTHYSQSIDINIKSLYRDKTKYCSYLDTKKTKKEKEVKKEVKKVTTALQKETETGITDLETLRNRLLSLAGNKTSKNNTVDSYKYLNQFIGVAKGKLGYKGVALKEFKGDYKGQGNSKAYIDTNLQIGRVILVNSLDKSEKQLEGVIEAVVRNYMVRKYGDKIQAHMIAEGIVYMLCKAIGLDVRTYCLSDTFETLARDRKQSATYVNLCHKVYKEIAEFIR